MAQTTTTPPGDMPVVKLSDPVKPDTAQMEILKDDARTGGMIGKVVADTVANGLGSKAGQYANVTVLAVFLMVFVWAQRESVLTARADREERREENRLNREASERIQSNSNAELRALSVEMRLLTSQVQAMASQSQGLIGEVRSLVRDIRAKGGDQ